MPAQFTSRTHHITLIVFKNFPYFFYVKTKNYSLFRNERENLNSIFCYIKCLISNQFFSGFLPLYRSENLKIYHCAMGLLHPTARQRSGMRNEMMSTFDRTFLANNWNRVFNFWSYFLENNCYRVFYFGSYIFLRTAETGFQLLNVLF